MEFYSQRHGIRKQKETTYNISISVYRLLLDCCKKYRDNLAWRYPQECEFCHNCRSLNHDLLDTALKYDIPSLFREDGAITYPKLHCTPFDGEIEDEFDQYALIDLIEFVANGCKDYSYATIEDDEICDHAYMDFTDSNEAFERFQKDINDIFEMVGLLYKLNDSRQIERIVVHTPLSPEVETVIDEVNETGIQDLLHTAVAFYKSPHPENHQLAVEKIWDAFERLKTYYTAYDKKHSVEKIISDMAPEQEEFKALLDAEFKALTEIGNNYRIRHHETNKIDITDYRHYDYFFNRCLSLIALAIQYLE